MAIIWFDELDKEKMRSIPFSVQKLSSLFLIGVKYSKMNRIAKIGGSQKSNDVSTMWR
jgi:hypothetical protein